MSLLDLGGNWHYSVQDVPDYTSADHDHTDWPVMHLPQNWFMAGLDHHGVVWFRYAFDYSLPPGQYATLRFEGVDCFADVYLNGVHLGRHEGYFEPFSFDVTEYLRSGTNLVAVRVDSPFEPVGRDGWPIRKRLVKGVLGHHDCRPGSKGAEGQSYNTGGIWNQVTLRSHDPVTIERVLLRADLSSEPHVLHGRLVIWNRGPTQDATLHVRVAPGNFACDVEFQSTQPLTLPAGHTTHVFTQPVPGVALWYPWDRGAPNLYQVTVSLTGDDPTNQIAEHAMTFGFRSAQVDAGYNWTLNGQRYFPRGSNYIASQWLSETLFPEVAHASTHPFPPPPGKETSEAAIDFGSLDPENWFERDVALMKQANLNIIRVHAHVLPPAFYTACDRAGVLVWQDFPLIWGCRDDPPFHAEAERQITAMVHLLYNHPSIVAWCCHNESPWDADWLTEELGYALDQNLALDTRLEETVRKLDPNRYVHRNSGTGDAHPYPGWYGGHWRDYESLPGAPFPTEYGAQGLPVRESLQHVFARFGPDAGHAALVRSKAWLDTQPEYRDSRRVPPVEATPPDLLPASEVWQAWCFHNFQPEETLEEGRVSLGASLDDFIASSQAYQRWIVQYATETYRRHKYSRITGALQFMFVEPWPAITWAVLDYWRQPKPAYDALRHAMQPVLPSADLLNEVPAGEPLRFQLCVVNDLLQSFPSAMCYWCLTDGEGKQLASGECALDLLEDSVSDSVPIFGPNLDRGGYRLNLTLRSAEGDLLGENVYRFYAR